MVHSYHIWPFTVGLVRQSCNTKLVAVSPRWLPAWGPGGGAGVLVGGTGVGVDVGKMTGTGVLVGGTAVGVSVGAGVSVGIGVSVAAIVGSGVTVGGMSMVAVANAAGGCSPVGDGGTADAVEIAATVSATAVSIFWVGAAATAVPSDSATAG